MAKISLATAKRYQRHTTMNRLGAIIIVMVTSRELDVLPFAAQGYWVDCASVPSG